MTTLEELAEKHGQERSLMNCLQGDYSFTLDQLRALIKEVVGEPVGEVECGAGRYKLRLNTADSPVYQLKVTL